MVRIADPVHVGRGATRTTAPCTKMRIATTTLAAVALCAAAITPTMADPPAKYPKTYKFLIDIASGDLLQLRSTQAGPASVA